MVLMETKYETLNEAVEAAGLKINLSKNVMR